MSRFIHSQFGIRSFMAASMIALMILVGGPYLHVSWQIPEDDVAQAFGVSGVYFNNNFPSCFQNYKDWTSSATFDSSAQWNTNFVAIAVKGNNNSSLPNVLQSLQDLNGDGLPDYFFSYRATFYDGQGNYWMNINDCVALNNGNGWDVAYKCVYDQGTAKFYGDCAG